MKLSLCDWANADAIDIPTATTTTDQTCMRIFIIADYSSAWGLLPLDNYVRGGLLLH